MIVTATRPSASRDAAVLTTAFLCLRSSGQRVLLLHGDLDSGPARMRRPRLAGRFVAFVADTSYHGVHDLSVEAFDLGRGRRVRRAPIAGSLFEKPDGRLLAEVRQIALNVRGTVAWRASGLLGDRSAEADTVGVADARGARVLETAPPGSLGDLRLTTTAVMWRAGGMPRSALLGDQ